MKLFNSEIEDEIDLNENQSTVEFVICNFYEMYDEKGAFWGLIDNTGKIIQFYWLEKDTWLVDIPNPPDFINYQMKADYKKCIEIIKNVLKENKVIALEDMNLVNTI